MSQNDYIIANQSAPDFRADLNDALQALASLSSGSSAPSTTYANMLWYDTANNILKMRSEADDAWINVSYLDQSSNAFRILDDTQVVNTSGTQTGLLGDQTEATWETGTSTTESLVSPAKVKAAIEALSPEGGGFTLIDSATPSGVSSVTFNSLDLSEYINLQIILDGLSPSNNNTTLTLVEDTTSTSTRLSTLGDFDAGDTLSALINVELLSGDGICSGLSIEVNTAVTISASSDISTSTTSLTFSLSPFNFDAGAIYLYGVK